MRTLLIAVIAMLSACDGSDAAAVEIDPLRCSVTFEKYAIVATINGDERLSKGLKARQSWYIQKVRALAPAQRSDSRVKELSEEADRVGDADLTFMKTCMEKQDADPEYKRWLRR